MQSSLLVILAVFTATAVSQYVAGIFSDFHAFDTLDLSISPPSMKWLFQLLWHLNSTLVKTADTFYLTMPCVAAIETSSSMILGTSETKFASCKFIVAESPTLQCSASEQLQKHLLVSGLLVFDVLPPSNMDCYAKAGWISVSDGSRTLISELNESQSQYTRADSAMAKNEDVADERESLVKRIVRSSRKLHFVKRLEDWQVLTKSEYYVSTRTVTRKVTSTLVSTVATTSVQPVTTITDSRVVVTLRPSSTDEQPASPTSFSTTAGDVVVTETVVVSSVQTQTVVLLSLVPESSDVTASVTEDEIPTKYSLAAEPTSLLPSLSGSELTLQLSTDPLPSSENSATPSSILSSDTSAPSTENQSTSPASSAPASSYMLSSEPSASISQTLSDGQSVLDSLNISSQTSSESIESSSSLATLSVDPNTLLSSDFEPSGSPSVSYFASSSVSLSLVPRSRSLAANSLVSLTMSSRSSETSTHRSTIKAEMTTFYTTVCTPPFHDYGSASTDAAVFRKKHRGRRVQSSNASHLRGDHATSDLIDDRMGSKLPDAESVKGVKFNNQRHTSVTNGIPVPTNMDVASVNTHAPISSEPPISSSQSMKTTHAPKDFGYDAGASATDFSRSVLLLIAILSLSATWV